MDRIKKQQYLLYSLYISESEKKDIELKVICKERLGDETVAKCKVMTKNWYQEIYLTKNDLYSGKVKILDL